MITMLLGGLWHGASWNFVLWGGLNGLGIVFIKFGEDLAHGKIKQGGGIEFGVSYSHLILFHLLEFGLEVDQQIFGRFR